MPRKRKRCWTAETLCLFDSHSDPQYDSEQDLGSPVAPIHRDVESSEEDGPILPRFLLQEFIFAHNSNEGYSHNRPGLLRNLFESSLPSLGAVCANAAWTPVPPHSTTATLVSVLQRHWSLETKNPARKTNRSYQGFCCRQLSSRTAHTEGSFPTGQACKGIFCADQIGFACEEFQRQNA